jgi:acyl-coenzyme A synthetase/AMP-(fatty) acid ligase
MSRKNPQDMGVLLMDSRADSAINSSAPTDLSMYAPIAFYFEISQIIMYTSGTTGLPKGAILSYRKTFYNVY